MTPANLGNVRVVWREDGSCVLFDAHAQRVSSPLPGVAGRVVELAAQGTDPTLAMMLLGVAPRSREALRGVLDALSSGRGVPPASSAIGDGVFTRLVLCPTSGCNLRCTYCYASAGESSDRMTPALARAAIDAYAGHSLEGDRFVVVFLGGGEPMTNPRAVEAAVEHARRVGRELGRASYLKLTTNGVFPAEVAEWVAGAFDAISLSFDGLPEVQASQRPRAGGGTAYDDVVRTLGVLRAAGKLGTINAVVTNESVDRMTQTLEHLARLGVENVRFQPVDRAGRGERLGLAAVDPARYRAAWSVARRRGEELGVRVVSFQEQLTMHSDHYCGGAGLNLVVGWSGQVATCHEAIGNHDEASRQLHIGRLADGRLEVDWDRIRHLRGRTFERMPECRRCAFRTNCAGGCLIRAARRSGSVDTVDETWCRLVKSTLGELVDELALRAARGGVSASPAQLEQGPRAPADAARLG